MKSFIDVKQDLRGGWFVHLYCCPLEWRPQCMPDRWDDHWAKFVKNLGFDNFTWLQSKPGGVLVGFERLEEANRLVDVLRALEESQSQQQGAP